MSCDNTDTDSIGATDCFVRKSFTWFLNRELGELPIAKLLHTGERSAATVPCLLPDEKPRAEAKETRRWR